MKNYKALRHFTEEMRTRQSRPNENRFTQSRERENRDKLEVDSSLRKVIQFFKGIRP